MKEKSSASSWIKTSATVCAVLSVLVYINSLDLTFSFDDNRAVFQNVDIRTNETSWFNLIRNDFWGTLMSSSDSHKSYRPLTVATFRLNYLLHELQPLGYHLVNVLLHSAVCYLYVLLCGVVFSEVWPALIAGLLFAVHPIHTEAVSGLVGRAEVLAGLFTLLAIHAYKRSLTTQKTGWFVLSLLLILCSALSKEIGITAVAICLFYELLIHRKMNVGIVLRAVFGSKSDLSPVHEQWLVQFARRAAMCTVFVLTFLYFRFKMNNGPPDFSHFNNPAMAFPTPLRQLHWSYLCVLNVWLLLSPSQLCAEYAMGTIPPIASLTDLRNLLTLATFASLLSVGCYAMSTRDAHHRKLLFGLCLMIIPFIPASNLFFPVGFVIAERVLYIPSMGFSMIVAYGAWCTFKKLKKSKTAKMVFSVLLFSLVLWFTLKTLVRNRDWMSNSTLYRATCKTTPNNPKMLNFLATSILLPEGYHDQAEKLYYYTIDVEPRYVSVYRNLAEMLRRIGKTNESIQVLRDGAKYWLAGTRGENFYFHDKDIQVLTELAKNLQEYTTSYEEALRYAEMAMEMKTSWVTPRRIKAMTLLKLGLVDEAESIIEATLEMKKYVGGYLTKGDIMETRGEWAEAEKMYRKALGMKHDNAEAKMKIAHILITNPENREERFHEAELLLTQVMKEEHSWKPLYYMCELHRKGGNRVIAKNYCNQSLQVDPNAPGPLHALGLFSFEEKRYGESVRLMRHLLSVSPGHLDGLVQLATSLMEMGGNEAEAKELFLRALDVDPHHIKALRHLGILYIRQSNLKEAFDVLSQLLKLDPSDGAVAKQLEILQKSIYTQNKQG